MDYTTKLSNNTNPSFKTREEEIREAADAIDIRVISNPWTLFQKGAEWADEHPKKVVFPLSEIEEAAKEIITEDWQKFQERLWNMIERNFRANFIHKACEWLKENRNNVETEDNGISGWISDDFIEQFRRAMKQ